MSVAIPFARSRPRLTRTSSLAQPLMRVAIAHAAPTAPAPIIPIFMMCTRLFSVKPVELNGEQGRRHVLDSEEEHPLPGRNSGSVPRYSKFPGWPTKHNSPDKCCRVEPY